MTKTTKPKIKSNLAASLRGAGQILANFGHTLGLYLVGAIALLISVLVLVGLIGAAAS